MEVRSSDSSAITRARQRPEHLGVLLLSHRVALKREIARFRRTRRDGATDSSDLLQITFAAACRSWPQFRGTSQIELFAWLRTIARRMTQRADREAIRQPIAVGQFRTGEATSSTASGMQTLAPSVAAEAERVSVLREQRELFERLLQQLNEQQRQVVVQRHFDERTFAEIAARLRKSPAAVRMIYLRAIDRLRILSNETFRADD